MWFASDEEWKQAEAPIIQLDSIISEFASLRGLKIGKNAKDWPERSLSWGLENRCLIQIYLESAEAKTLNLWVCVSEDRGRKRYWKQTFLHKAVPIATLLNTLHNDLESAFTMANEWSANPNQLEFVTNLGM
ncbi:hypothetical protein [Pseudokordiimonas caeni]|uniref:hypothetical protein n=1 Tax=Pseudokordiimonas caeni TaxID=2997908 RepID=UPI00281151AB|nr:hypothetical protein [Pseudokordiimonas caeni]